MKRILFGALLTAVLFIGGTAYALDLGQARSSGLVGEKTDGYTAVVSGSAEASALVAEVNARRKAEYEKISKQNNQPVSVVAKLAAEQIINGLPAGSYYQGADGSWKKK